MGETSGLRLILSIFDSAASLARLLISLVLIWLTFGWRVRRARKAFEKELIKQGMARQDAKRIGAQYTTLKDNIVNAFKQSIRIWG